MNKISAYLLEIGKKTNMLPRSKREAWTMLALGATVLFWACTFNWQVFSYVSQNFFVVHLLSAGPMYIGLIYIAYTCSKREHLEEPKEESNAPEPCTCCSCCNFKARSNEEKGKP